MAKKTASARGYALYFPTASGHGLSGAIIHRMYRFATGTLDIKDLRERLRKMTDAALKRFGEAARFMCSPKANMGKPPRQNSVI